MARRDEARLIRLFARLLPLSAALPLTVAACSRASSTKVDAAAHDGGAEERCAPALDHVILPSNDGGPCDAFERLPCGLPPSVRPIDAGCDFTLNDCESMCPSYGAFRCRAADASCPAGKLVQGGITVMCDFCGGGLGRRPRGLAPPEGPRAVDVLGAFFSDAAYLEAASVHAFRALEGALLRLGAPRTLVRAARAAAADEVRHARITARFAARHGGAMKPVRVVAQREPPNLERLATENAVEGCVGETYGALIASFQAGHARDPQTARAMRRIATDETRHAALAWAVARWARRLLDEPARARVATALAGAAALLMEGVENPDAALVRYAGVPDAAEQRRLISGLQQGLWEMVG